jgi:hypothetical protein
MSQRVRSLILLWAGIFSCGFFIQEVVKAFEKIIDGARLSKSFDINAGLCIHSTCFKKNIETWKV